MSLPSDFFDGKGNFIPMKLVELITGDELENRLLTPITERGGDTIWHYKHNLGIYKPDGIAYVKEEAKRALKKRSKTAYVNEVVYLTLIDTYIQPEEFVEDPNLLVVINGALYVDTGELENHNHTFYAKAALPVVYDPDAECPTILKFLGEVIPDSVDTFQEWLGYHLYKNMIYHKAAMFIGDGANGKTTLQDLMNAFLGPDNVSHVNLYRLVSSRFATSELYGKLANISPEIASDELKRTGTFKSLTGHDRIMAEKKFRDPFYYTNHAKLTFLCNTLPTTPDKTLAFFRRWLLFVFPNKFEGPNRDPQILDKLTTSEELSGLLNWALLGLRRLQENGNFTKSMTADELQELYESMSDPITAFIDEKIVLEPSGVASKDAVYQAYHEFCKTKGYTTVTKGTLTTEIKARLAGVLESKRKIRGKPQRCWIGLRLNVGTLGTVGTLSYPKESLVDWEGGIEVVPPVPTVPDPEASQKIEIPCDHEDQLFTDAIEILEENGGCMPQRGLFRALVDGGYTVETANQALRGDRRFIFMGMDAKLRILLEEEV
ncbi:MAG: phage/plasmid primase, P4 family [Candidatus Bathyarchaeota archaeon]|nr:phage/plasmid primase, P4 family [Candidatus Bathyarchaeota archaeon]